MHRMKHSLRATALALACVLASSAFAPPALAKSNPTIRLGYVESWPSSRVTTKLAANIIRNDLHYPVKLVAVSAGLMYEGVARGSLDAMLSAWLPVTQRQYYKKVWPHVITLGPNVRGTFNGLAVPTYVKNVNSIADLKNHAAEFNHKIYGEGAGAGINQDARQAIKQYNLNFNLVKSSVAAMAASLKRAVERNKPIVITAWTPFWIWSKFHLKFLKDPKKIFGRAGYVETLTSRKLPDKAAPVYYFLRAFEIKVSTVNRIEANAKGNISEAKAISQWTNNHPDEVARWVTYATHSAK